MRPSTNIGNSQTENFKMTDFVKFAMKIIFLIRIMVVMPVLNWCLISWKMLVGDCY